MTTPDPNSKKGRRDAARERARIAREKEQQRRRRNRWFRNGGIALGVIAIAAVIVIVVNNSVQPAGPGPRNMASDGIVLRGQNGKIVPVSTGRVASGATPKATKQSDDVANITIYEDYICPVCNQFETTNMTQIKQWVKGGQATLELHPFNLLDRSSLGTKYSTRATNAAACVANYQPSKFLDVNSAFYAKQPSENTKGLTNDQIVDLVQSAGATDKRIPSCIRDGEFTSWVGAQTNRVLNDKIPNSSLASVTGTPTVIVNGKQYPGSVTDAAAFAAFVEQTVAGSTTSGSSTTAPSSSATPSAG